MGDAHASPFERRSQMQPRGALDVAQNAPHCPSEADRSRRRPGRADAGEPAGAATKTWVLPVSTPGCEVTISEGGGIVAANGDRATFGGNAKVLSPTQVNGPQEYQDHGPAQPANVHGNVLAVTCSADRTAADIFGQATVDGAGSFDYRIRVFDGGEPGRGIDEYGILVANGYASGDQTLTNGNVQIQVHE
jgi:hypothetical protein